jgi:hypothetical protein
MYAGMLIIALEQHRDPTHLTAGDSPGALVPVAPLANTRLIRLVQSVGVPMIVVEHVGQDGIDQEAPLVVVNRPVAFKHVVIASIDQSESIPFVVNGSVVLKRVVVAAELESVAARVPLAD